MLVKVNSLPTSDRHPHGWISPDKTIQPESVDWLWILTYLNEALNTAQQSHHISPVHMLSHSSKQLFQVFLSFGLFFLHSLLPSPSCNLDVLDSYFTEKYGQNQRRYSISSPTTTHVHFFLWRNCPYSHVSHLLHWTPAPLIYTRKSPAILPSSSCIIKLSFSTQLFQQA